MGAQLLVDAGPRLTTRRVSGPTSPSRYRHPGDVLRLITSGVILVSALVIAALMPERLLGSRAATVQGWSPTPSPASCTGLVQAVAIAAVVAVVVALMRRRRFRLLGTLAGGAVFAGPGWRAPDGAPPGSPDGTEHQSAHVILVSNGRYDLTGPQAFGSRRRLDGGTSGIVTVKLRSSRDLARFIQMETTMGGHHASGVGSHRPTLASRCDQANPSRSASTARPSCSTRRPRSRRCVIPHSVGDGCIVGLEAHADGRVDGEGLVVEVRLSRRDRRVDDRHLLPRRRQRHRRRE